MNDLVTSDWFWVMVQAIVVFVTLALIYRQVKLQTATHVVQTLAAMHQRWSEDSMLRARYSVCARYLAGDKAFDGISEYIAEFMEELGGYVKMGAVPVGVMWDAQSWYLEHYYPMFKAGIESTRQTYHDVTLYSNMESLFLQMSKHSAEKNAPNPERGEGDLRRFAQSEVQVASAFLNLHIDDRAIAPSDLEPKV
jgi:hypothetical protein